MFTPDYETWFEDAYARYLPKMLKITVRRLRNIELAQEIVHDTFLVLWDKRECVYTHPNIEGFLIKTLGNVTMHALRTLSKAKEVALDKDYPTVDEYSFSRAIDFPVGLTDDERRLLYWRFTQNVSYREIADRLKISEETCRVRVYRAKQHFIALLKC